MPVTFVALLSFRASDVLNRWLGGTLRIARGSCVRGLTQQFRTMPHVVAIEYSHGVLQQSWTNAPTRKLSVSGNTVCIRTFTDRTAFLSTDTNAGFMERGQNGTVRPMIATAILCEMLELIANRC
jgi:hypothetical protein